MFVESRNDAREFFLRVWRKMAADEPLEPMEAIVAQVISAHPEYHPVLEHPERALEQDYDGSDGRSNPFLHMGLHIAIIEQLQTDRPPGIRAEHSRLVKDFGGDVQAAEHAMIECLAETLWEAGGARPPDERAYLARLRRVTR